MVGDATYTFDIWEALIRILKYAIEALFVALAAYALPQQKLKVSEIWMIALTAACVFSIFDLLSPSISAGARQGVGLGAGFRLVGFPAV
jgi:hypothetical protein